MNILNKLTVKHLKMNKKRTVVTIIGVVLSTALMVGIGLLLSTLRDNSIKEVILDNGSQHAIFKDVDYNKRELILQNDEVSKVKINSLLGYAKLENGTNEYKPYLKVLKVDENYLNDLKLIEGNLPQNEKEIVISNHIAINGGVNYKVGDKLTLEVGKRYLDGEELSSIELAFNSGEELKNTTSKEYTIVGIVNRDIQENYADSGYSVFTKNGFNKDDKLNIFVEYKKVMDTYNLSEIIGKNLGYNENQLVQKIDYNDSLLALYGTSSYGNLTSSMTGILAIMLGLISIGCIIVIYNSFAISVMERKKQFGLFASIGTTRKQLRKTVFFEATIIGLIGVPLGILASYIGIGTVIAIVNALLPNVFSAPLQLATYPVFLIIPIIFMLAVIYISAFLPAHRASKVTPIEAIRQNDDIKIKRKIKKNHLISKLFKVEGEIAHKNMQRNKKKYRITIASLVISIVLFISFSSFMEYMLHSMDVYTNLPDYDIHLSYTKKNDQHLENMKDILKHEQVDKYIQYTVYYRSTNSIENIRNSYSKEFEKFFLDSNYSPIDMMVSIYVMDNDTYDKYLKELGKTEIKPILYSPYRTIVYKNDERKGYEINRYSKVTDINLCNRGYDEKQDADSSIVYECDSKFSDYYISTTAILGKADFDNSLQPTFIVRESEKNKYIKDLEPTYYVTYINADKYDKLDEYINKTIDENKLDITYYNVAKELQLMKNLMLVINLLVYGFISLVTLIGVTSVFNTISTSIALRRKEFSMLRSMGLTPKGFNKIIRFESLFVGVKALVIGLPISFIVTLLLHWSMNGIVSSSLIIPWKSILITVVGVFLIILISMSYSVRKIKKENILDAIREENI